MSPKCRVASRLLAVLTFASLSLTIVVEAQPFDPGQMMGPGMMDWQLFGSICGPRAAGFAEWRLDHLERVIKPTEAQRVKFDEFKVGSNNQQASARATEDFFNTIGQIRTFPGAGSRSSRLGIAGCLQSAEL